MGTPVIDSFTASPNPVIVGNPVQFTATAHDPDAKEYEGILTSRDANRDGSTASVTVSVSDPITYELVIKDKASGQVVQSFPEGTVPSWSWTPSES